MQSTAATPLDRARRTDIRLSTYGPQQALELTKDLVHLETAARVPADLDLTWLTTCLQRDGFALVTASLDGRLAGFVAANATGGHVAIERLVVAAAALSAHPELPVTLLRAAIDGARMPWADVVVPRAFPGLAVLLEEGWRPVVGETGPRGQIRLSAAHVDLP